MIITRLGPRFLARVQRLCFSTKMETKVEVNGQTINYVKVGTGCHPVLCIPGALGTAWSDFKPQIEGLAPDKFTIIAFDPPGYGFSRPPDRNFSPELYLNDAKMANDFMRKINYKKYSVLGWSDGGIAGLIMAAKFPEAIKKLVVWGSNAYIVQSEMESVENIRDISKWSEKMKNPLIELYTEQGLQDMWNAWCNVYVTIHNENQGDICKSLLPSIECPVYILHGDKDPMIAPEHPDYLKENIKKSELYRFPDGKHNIHLRYAREFNNLVTEFLLK